MTSAKDAAGKAAAELVQDGMLVGLGTGTTASFFIKHLIDRCQQGLKITAVATSKRSKEMAEAGGIPIIDMDKITEIDFTADGADEIDSQKRMIKGGGGALLREKIVDSASKDMVVIIDSSKLVERLGTFPLPLEVLPFGSHITRHKIEKLGLRGEFRQKENELYLTDNGNYIFDIHFPKPLDDPEVVNERLQAIPGILETGFFFNIAHRVIVGYPDGRVEFRT